MLRGKNRDGKLGIEATVGGLMLTKSRPGPKKGLLAKGWKATHHHLVHRLV